LLQRDRMQNGGGACGRPAPSRVLAAEPLQQQQPLR